MSWNDPLGVFVASYDASCYPVIRGPIWPDCCMNWVLILFPLDLLVPHLLEPSSFRVSFHASRLE